MKEIRGKYQHKNYEEVTYELEEITCRHCGVPFMIDYAYLPTRELEDQADLFYKITCPYCGKITLKHP